jgi:molybdenum cofactor cytidylyltransferase
VTPRFPRIATIVLAAGASERMGQPKMLLPVGRTTLLAASVAPHLEAGLGRVVVVLGCDAARVRGEAGLPADPRLAVVVNRSWREGMSSSLRRGLRACAGMEAVLIALGDEAGVTAARVARVAGAWDGTAPLVVPRTSDGRGSHPVLFARCLWKDLRALRGDVGAREVVRRNRARAVRVAVPRLHDVDHWDDYRSFLAGGRARPSGLEIPPGKPGRR